MSDLPRSPGTTPLAVIVEDNDSVARVFRAAADRAGFQTEWIPDGQQALRRLDEINPDLVVLDVHLPFVSGREILKHIRSDPRKALTWVVVATADITAARDLVQAADFVLEKPCGFTELYELAKQLRQKLDR